MNVKRGEPGSLVHKSMCEVECYTAMPSNGWQKRLVELILDQPDVTGNRNSYGATPEASIEGQMLMLEGGDVKIKNTKQLVPARQNWSMFAEARVDMITQAVESDAPEVQGGTSAARLLIFSMCLTIARYIYLLEIVKLFCDSEGQAWGAAWRYIERFHRQYFLGASNTTSALSQQLVKAYKDRRVGRRNAAISALVRGSRDTHMLNTAVEHHRAAVRAGEPMEKADKKAAPMEGVPKKDKEKRVKGPAGVCPLCLSQDHVYHVGDYGHTHRNTISEVCVRPQTDGAPCGKIHAFAGPLKSDCRQLPAHNGR